MASLTGTQINNTYPSLLKTTGNTAIGGTQVNITDGEGNATPLSMSSSTLQVSGANIELVESTGGNNLINIDATKINFEGAVDFTNATVTGIGGGGGFVGVSDTTKVAFTTEQVDAVYKSVIVPANTFTAGDILTFDTLLNLDMSNGGWIYWSAWIAEDTGLLSGVAFGGGAEAAGTTGMAVLSKHMYIYSADGTGDGTSVLSDLSAVEQQNNNGFTQYNDSNVRAIDWTVDQYINFAAFIDNAGNSITFNGAYIKKQN